LRFTIDFSHCGALWGKKKKKLWGKKLWVFRALQNRHRFFIVTAFVSSKKKKKLLKSTQEGIIFSNQWHGDLD
jgi:hypothetical protein